MTHANLLLFSTLVTLFRISISTDAKLFEKKPKLEMIHADQISAITHHDDLCDGTQLNHPRVAHNLLGYVIRKTNYPRSMGWWAYPGMAGKICALPVISHLEQGGTSGE